MAHGVYTHVPVLGGPQQPPLLHLFTLVAQTMKPKQLFLLF